MKEISRVIRDTSLYLMNSKLVTVLLLIIVITQQFNECTSHELLKANTISQNVYRDSSIVKMITIVNKFNSNIILHKQLTDSVYKRQDSIFFLLERNYNLINKK